MVVRNAADKNAYEMLDKTACEVLTLDKAKTLLSETAQKKDATSADVETNSIHKTRCEYATQGQTVQDMWTLSLEVREAKNAAGAAENATDFPPHTTPGKLVPGYGDEALWDELAGRFRILKAGNYYTISMSKGMGAAAITLAELQKIAAAIGLKD